MASSRERDAPLRQFCRAFEEELEDGPSVRRTRAWLAGRAADCCEAGVRGCVLAMIEALEEQGCDAVTLCTLGVGEIEEETGIEGKDAATFIAEQANILARAAKASGVHACRGLPPNRRPGDASASEAADTSVVVLGDTGAGKSTCLNAVLGEESILPTNGLRACTAAIVELRFNDRHDVTPYRGEVEFIPREQWEEEKRLMREAVEAAEAKGEWKGGRPPPESPEYVNWLKLRAVSAEMEKALGTTRSFLAKTGAQLKALISPFVDSSDDLRGAAWWPIVRKAVLQGPWECLSGGVVLVDAPGVRDDNSARDAVVKQYLADADSVLLVSNIRRAVNDKTVREALLPVLKERLATQGFYGQLALVATQADQVPKISELAKNLKLDTETATLLDCALERNASVKRYALADYHSATAAGGEGDDASAQQHHVGAKAFPEYAFEVFTVSAVDFQKIEGIREGEPQTFHDAEHTEVPALRKFLHRLAAAKRLRSALAWPPAVKAGALMMTAKRAAAAEADGDEDGSQPLGGAHMLPVRAAVERLPYASDAQWRRMTVSKRVQRLAEGWTAVKRAGGVEHALALLQGANGSLKRAREEVLGYAAPAHEVPRGDKRAAHDAHAMPVIDFTRIDSRAG